MRNEMINIVSGYHVIFVCMGNICRSPMAEIVLRHHVREAGLTESVKVSSAGTGGWHVGHPADVRSQAALASRGYPTDHRARQFDPRWFTAADLIVALDHVNETDLRRLAPPSMPPAIRLLRSFDPDADGTEVADPYHGSAEDFSVALAQVERACVGLLTYVKEQLTRPPIR